MFRQPDELVTNAQPWLTALIDAILGLSVKNKGYRKRNLQTYYVLPDFNLIYEQFLPIRNSHSRMHMFYCWVHYMQ